MVNQKPHLRKLLQTYLANCGDTVNQKSIFWAYVCGWVPEPAAPAVFKENGLTLSGNEKSLYRDSYRQLRLDRAIEHLESKDLNERLAGLAREFLESKDQFKNQVILNDRIQQFLDELIKPEENYKVLFAINNLRAKIAETVFWDCTLASYSREELFEWGYKPDKKYFPVGPDAFEDRNVIIISERGTNVAEIVMRARVKAIGRLRILQHYLKEELIHDEQLFFSLSKESAVKRESDGCVVSTGIDHRKFTLVYMSRNTRDDFTAATVRDLARRASYICSNPECHNLTIGPASNDFEKIVFLGKAAHITAASPQGARYDPSLTAENFEPYQPLQKLAS